MAEWGDRLRLAVGRRLLGAAAAAVRGAVRWRHTGRGGWVGSRVRACSPGGRGGSSLGLLLLLLLLVGQTHVQKQLD